jgi:hypothetical protein
MIPIDRIQPINGPNDVFTFPATAEISELAFRPGGLRIVHSRQGLWPPVSIDGKASADDDQEATLWVILQIDGNWVGAGMERLRPRQTDKPEPNDPLGFVSEWVSGRNFGPFNGHAIKSGDPIGFMVVPAARVSGPCSRSRAQQSDRDELPAARARSRSGSRVSPILRRRVRPRPTPQGRRRSIRRENRVATGTLPPNPWPMSI